MKRKAISKSVRFRIFARDNFTCRYCGRQSDVVVLHCDHVIPVCQGGTNDDENLITSCVDCNLGKAGKTITQAAPTEMDRLRLAQESGEQMKSAQAARDASKARAQLRQEVCNYFCEARGVDAISSPQLSTLVAFVNEFGAELVFSWIDSAAAHVSASASEKDFCRYISGCRRRYLENFSKNA